MAQIEIRPHEGLLDRAYETFSIVDMLPDDMSDKELEGILHILPSDLQKNNVGLPRGAYKENKYLVLQEDE